MSPSSRPAPALGLALAVVCLLAGGRSGAQVPQQGAFAVLLSGPHPVRDLPMFPPNALAAWAGEYGLGDKRAGVLYTREPLVLPGTWRPRRCGSLRLLEVADYEPSSLCYADPEGFTLFFSFPSDAEGEGRELEQALRCPFVEAFVRRFQLLRGLVRQPREVPFPGVLEIRAP